MRHIPSVSALVAAVFFAGAWGATTGAGTEKPAPFSRRNPVTEAVARTRTAIVTVKVPRPGGKDNVGTGVVVDERGYIVTNRHVVGAHRKVNIQLHDGHVVSGDVVVLEPGWDLAVVRIRTDKTLAALPFAPAEDLLVGETVIAVGHPFGYRHTVSTGVVSALDREVEMPTGDVLTGLIQTSAPINPGNSGGPLLNVNGEMIGINVALRDGAQGIAFAINSGTVRRVLKKHLSASNIAGVDHGLVCKDEVIAETGPRQKVIVEACHTEMTSPLERGDAIVAIGTKDVVNSFDIERAFWDARPGQRVEIRILRDGREITTTLTLRPNPAAARR